MLAYPVLCGHYLTFLVAVSYCHSVAVAVAESQNSIGLCCSPSCFSFTQSSHYYCALLLLFTFLLRFHAVNLLFVSCYCSNIIVICTVVGGKQHESFCILYRMYKISCCIEVCVHTTSLFCCLNLLPYGFM